MNELHEFLLMCCPGKESVTTISLASLQKRSALRPANTSLWRQICARQSPSGHLSIYSPLSLRNISAPRITINDKGQHVVYTGKGKGEDMLLNLFSPLTGETAVDGQVLARTLEGLQVSDSMENEVELRKPEEAIFICLDVSNSMSNVADFPDDEDDEDDGNLSDDEHWQWGSPDDSDVKVKPTVILDSSDDEDEDSQDGDDDEDENDEDDEQVVITLPATSLQELLLPVHLTQLNQLKLVMQSNPSALGEVLQHFTNL